MEESWKKKLTAFDASLCRMIESLTEQPCEPKLGCDCYFIEIDYSKHNDPQYILAIWDAVEGRAGKRLKQLKDIPERECLYAEIIFYSEPCKDAAFVPKIEQE